MRQDSDLAVPIYRVPVKRLRESFVAVAADQENTNLLALDREATQAEFMQQSRVFGFVDHITVGFITISEIESSLAIFSRSKIGLWDMGVNRRRIQTWLTLLEERLEEERLRTD